MTREPPGADSPGPERRPPNGRQWRRWTRPRAIPGTSSAGTSQVSTGHSGWIRSKKEDLQHERLKLDHRGSSQPRDRTCSSCISRRCFTTEPSRKPNPMLAMKKLRLKEYLTCPQNCLLNQCNLQNISTH